MIFIAKCFSILILLVCIINVTTGYNELYEYLYDPTRSCDFCNSETVASEFDENTAYESQKVRKNYPHEENIRYGSNPKQLYDEYYPLKKLTKSPTFVFLHGGYWRAGDKNTSAYMVPPLVKAGIRVVVANYDLAPKFSLKTMVQEMKELVKALYDKGKSKKWGRDKKHFAAVIKKVEISPKDEKFGYSTYFQITTRKLDWLHNSSTTGV